jgi:hypothetical protein
MQTATQFTVHNHTVRTLLAAAYSLSPNEIIGGPPLIDSDHWAIVATTPGPRPTLEQQMAMLRISLRLVQSCQWTFLAYGEIDVEGVIRSKAMIPAESLHRPNYLIQ